MVPVWCRLRQHVEDDCFAGLSSRIRRDSRAAGGKFTRTGPTRAAIVLSAPGDVLPVTPLRQVELELTRVADIDSGRRDTLPVRHSRKELC